jgi:DNA-binding NarL/FixJ family response regulator
MKGGQSMDAFSRRHSAVVFDRHPLWLSELGRVLERGGFALAGAATSEALALQLVRQQQPDVIVFEPEACTSGTARFLEAARAAGPQLRAVAVSTIDDPDAIRAVLRAGAWAYVLKSAEPDDIAVAVRQAFVHSIHLTRTLEPADPARGSAARSPDGPAVSVLTRREREILALVAEGHSNSTMAKSLWVTEQTVKFHLSNIYRKLDVPNRTAATRWAHEHGLIGEATAGGLEVLAAG